jgi:hypothetical protein
MALSYSPRAGSKTCHPNSQAQKKGLPSVWFSKYIGWSNGFVADWAPKHYDHNKHEPLWRHLWTAVTDFWKICPVNTTTNGQAWESLIRRECRVGCKPKSEEKELVQTERWSWGASRLPVYIFRKLIYCYKSRCWCKKNIQRPACQDAEGGGLQGRWRARLFIILCQFRRPCAELSISANVTFRVVTCFTPV